MKKKIAMRVASLALCVAFTGMMFGAPKSKAVAVETAIGTAAVASYFQATGLTMAASAGSTGALVTTGVADIVGSYAVATGAASSGSAFLSSLAAGVSISPAGALVLTAAAVVAIGALVAWYVGEKGLVDESSTCSVIGSYGFYDNVGNFYPASYKTSDFDYNKDIFPDSIYYFDSGSYGLLDFYRNGSGCYEVSFNGKVFLSCGRSWYSCFAWIYDPNQSSFYWPVYSPCDITDSTPLGLKYEAMGSATIADMVKKGLISSFSAEELSVTRSPEFIQPDTELEPESKKQMVIDLGFTPGITLDEVVELVPEQIAAGTLEPTYQIIINEPGEGTEEEPEPELQPEVVPLLQSIKTTLTSIPTLIADSVMDGLQTMFVPSEVYMESLPERITDTFDERTGFLTYPFSLLPDFVDRLSAPSGDWILKWPQIAEPFTGTILFQQGSWNVTAFVQANAQIKRLYDLWRLIAKALMSFGFIGLCYNKYCSVVGDRYGEG